MKRIKQAAAALAVAAATCLPAQAGAAERRLVLVTLDGLDWTEVFRGADVARTQNQQFVTQPGAVKPFTGPEGRPAALMPFLHGVMAKQGVLIGDRDKGSCAAVSNDRWFSYPGYNEFLTGRADPAITSNAAIPNKNVTVLEWLNRQPAYQGKVRAVASWGVVHEIVNGERSGVPVNAGPRPFKARDALEAALGRVQADAPAVWHDSRIDAFTHAFVLETLRKDKPEVLYIGYADTDDFAHEGRYDQVLMAAHRIDGYLGELWRLLQADPAYAGKTTLIVSVDHGRGSGQPGDWRDHGKPRPGSDAAWIAAIGPGIKPGVLTGGGCVSTSQIAATGLKALGLDWQAFDATAGAPLPIFAP